MKITAISNKNVQKWLELKTTEGRQKDRLFLVEGEKLVSEAAKSGILETVIYTNKIPQSLTKFENIVEVDTKVMKKLSNLTTPNSIIGVCKIVKIEDSLPDVLIALDGVQDPGNGGNILRSCLGFGIKKMLVSEDNFDQYNDKFIRSTMGAFFKIGIEKVDLSSKLKELKTLGYKVIVTTALGGTDYKVFKNQQKLIVVFGSEGHGISKPVLALADFNLGIKINKELESLNVSSAAAIILHELMKMRN